MLLEVFPGETVRLKAKDLTHRDSGPVIAGATVTITLYNPDGSVATTESGATGGTGDDWYADVAAPATVGVYEFKVVAVASGATWKGKDTIRVVAF